MRLVFLGTGEFAVPSFEAVLEAGHDVAALVTQPDREKGRGQKVVPPPIKPVAEARGVPVLQPRRIREEAAVAALRDLRPDVLVVVAYGQILPKAVLDAAPRGAVNVHGSLLPRWRGAAPIQWAIASGDAETGVTTMLLDVGLDTGPILLARATLIGPEETTPELSARLAASGAELLTSTLRGLEDGSIVPRPQDDAQATAARILTKDDGRLDWRLPAASLACRVRGFHPWPGTFALFQGRALKVLRARAEHGGADDPPAGSVVAVDANGVVVACGGGSHLRLLELQPESRKAMSATAFAQGARLRPGLRLD
ncbi:MAG TPA: methionyl-tRNA formyltransferase [Vicinamibacteria bacterium]|nr:methionyl-tRNA formyltransferase [Vicinamibacteria bacterium]